VLLVDDDQSQIRERQEQRRARADDDRGLAARDCPPGIPPRRLTDLGMPLRRLRSEAAAERNRDKYFRIKRSLHETEVRAAYNPVLTQTMRSLHAQSRRFWFTYERTERFPEAAERHRLIVHYLAKHDAKRAVAAVEALFSFLEAMTKQALERRGPS